MRLLFGLVLFVATPAFAAEPAPQPRAAVAAPEPTLGQLAPLCADSAGALLQLPARADPALPTKNHPLTDEPAANIELTVQRSIDGCPSPVVVRYDVDERQAIPEELR